MSPLSERVVADVRRQEIFHNIIGERQRQDAKWGEQNHGDSVWSLIFGEEYGEVQKAILEGDEAAVEEELVQLVGVGVAWLEARSRSRAAA